MTSARSAIDLHRNFSYRQNLLLKLKIAIVENKHALLEALVQDLNKPLFEAYSAEISFVLEEIDFALQNLKAWIKPKSVATPLKLKPGNSFVHFEPYGRVLILAAWNYPFQVLFSPLVGALAAGNSAVLKPSEMAPYTEKVICKMIKTYFEPDDIDVQMGGPEETQLLLKQKWDFIFFTGSTAVGKVILKAAAENLTPVCLELGGKSPCVIEEDAALAVSVKRIVWGKFFNAGQTCIAPDYVLIHEKVYAKALELFKKYMAEFYQQSLQSSDYCKIINKKHFDRVREFLKNTEILYGGASDPLSCKIEPTLIRGDLQHASMKEEIFGPVLPLFSFSRSEEAIAMIQKFEKALTMYIFSEDSQKQQRYLDAISFGSGCINDCLLHYANNNMAFGGVGASGMGAYHGYSTFELLSHKKTILKRSSFFDPDFRYPPYKDKMKTWVRFFLK